MKYDVLIIGGGKITAYLGKELSKGKFNVNIIEKDKNRCLELSELLPNATIIHGDGSDQSLLLEEGVASIDAIVPLTNSDEENIIAYTSAALCFKGGGIFCLRCFKF